MQNFQLDGYQNCRRYPSINYHLSLLQFEQKWLLTCKLKISYQDRPPFTLQATRGIFFESTYYLFTHLLCSPQSFTKLSTKQNEKIMLSKFFLKQTKECLRLFIFPYILVISSRTQRLIIIIALIKISFSTLYSKKISRMNLKFSIIFIVNRDF